MPFEFFLRERWNIVAIKELRDQSKYCFQKADKNVIMKEENIITEKQILLSASLKWTKTV